MQQRIPLHDTRNVCENLIEILEGMGRFEYKGELGGLKK